jgi:hypothetical protein
LTPSQYQLPSLFPRSMNRLKTQRRTCKWRRAFHQRGQTKGADENYLQDREEQKVRDE